jgi:hypothetical protein
MPLLDTDLNINVKYCWKLTIKTWLSWSFCKVFIYLCKNFFEMAVTRLERKARRNKTRAKERTLAIKRNIRRNFVASPYKEESGIILEDDVLTVAKNLSTGEKPKAKKAAKKVEEAPEATA